MYDNFVELTKMTEFTSNPLLNRVISETYAKGKQDPSFSFFFSIPEENKENLLEIHNRNLTSRINVSLFVFFTYNGVKSLLWRRGYFAYFFFHTRFLSPVLLLMSLKAISNDYHYRLVNDDLFAYSLNTKLLIRFEENLKFQTKQLSNKKEISSI